MIYGASAFPLHMNPELWVLVALLFFLLIAYRFGWKPLMGILDQRSASIRAELEEAKQLQETAKASCSNTSKSRHRARARLPRY